MDYSQAARTLWAKSDRGGPWQSVLGHMLEVAASAYAVLQREPERTRRLLAEDFDLPVDEALPWVCALAGLHDIGKASPAFQQKWPVGRARLPKTLRFRGPTPPGNDVPHGAITFIALEEYLRQRGWSRKAARLASDAVAGHHGWRIGSDDQDRACLPREAGDDAWEAARTELMDLVLTALGVGDAPTVGSLRAAAFMRLAGLTSFADWIGSGLQLELPESDLSSYVERAVSRAETALDGIGWAARTPLIDTPVEFGELFAYLAGERTLAPLPLQEAVAELVAGADAPLLMIVEAPMGEGKTEAALLAHVELQRRLGHRGLYIALPTQATGNAMFDRARDFLEQVGRDRPKPLDLQLLHGATLLAPSFQHLMMRSGDGSEDPVGARKWFSHRKRALLSEYGVGTVDQALLACMPVKHQFVRLWGLGNRTVVLDEVHAYDTYTSGLIAAMVAWLAALDSSVIVMSATLPDGKRGELLRAYGGMPGGGAVPYPRVSIAPSGAQVRQVHVPAARASSVHVESAPLEIEALAEMVAGLTHGGGLVGCIVNTVRRAQALHHALAERVPEVPRHLFHARYPVIDRQRRETETLALFGKQASRPGRAILIATQVAEQSLDLDLDVLVTDLAPIDLVLQRAGRMHRHQRSSEERSGHAEARLFVAGLTRGEQPPQLEPEGFERIYEPAVMLRSWAVLREREVLRFPEDIDRLVQLVYAKAWPPGLPHEVQAALAEAEAARDVRIRVQRAEASAAVIGLPSETAWTRPAPHASWLQEEGETARLPIAPTRLGPERVTGVLLHEVDGVVALDPQGRRPARLVGPVDGEHAIALYQRSVSLSHKSVVQGLRKIGVPSGWEEHPLLHDCYPLVLRAAQARIGSATVTWDEEVGVCISWK